MNQCGDMYFLLGLRMADMTALAHILQTPLEVAFAEDGVRLLGCVPALASLQEGRCPLLPLRQASRQWLELDRRWGRCLRQTWKPFPWRSRAGSVGVLGGVSCFYLGWERGRKERNQPTEIGLLDGFFFNAPLRETNSAKLH